MIDIYKYIKIFQIFKKSSNKLNIRIEVIFIL